ncbi:heme-binding protein [Pleionea sp. CnH1-48]|uniref:GlcG/HbpS family heme-binding protein n=1 Tax=Pleionea sp. CnH1-48 TaxID=2954494 RepID=UPI00209704FD|nr:heme-binding protein [Pleionea sp. CnH1-48]MCO7223307.1 heme-binding protein [Pleionea sp. CnH1-48]
MNQQIIPLLFTGLMAMSVQANQCQDLPGHQQLTEALKKSVKTTGAEVNGGLEFNMWATIVDRTGSVCAVTYSGDEVDAQWLGSRVISAQKANTANAFSLNNLALSTANLWTATQPGGSLFGLQHSNPVNTAVAYRGAYSHFGSSQDPMIGGKIGGVNVFGGGLALYNKKGDIIGALGVSGDTSCADHNIAWKTRDALKLDYVPAGVSATNDDNIIYQSEHGFAHPVCGGEEAQIGKKLPKTHPINLPSTLSK